MTHLMNNTKKTLPFILIMGMTPFSFAGTSDGGGGAGVRCPKSSSDIAFELLDLHEIQLNGEQIANSPTTLDEAIELSATKLGKHYYVPSIMPASWYIDFLKKNLVEKIFTGQSFTNPANGTVTKIEYVNDLSLADDLGNYRIKPGCALEQVAYYFDQTNSLKIVTSRWNELSWTDRSALVSHEIQYFLDRYNGLEDFGSNVKKTSTRARHFVGMLYSKTGIEPKYKSIPATGTLDCATNSNSLHKNTQFTVFSSGTNEFTAVFESIQNYSSAYATKAVFTNDILPSLTDWLDGEMDSTRLLNIATTETVPGFSVQIKKAPHQEPRLQAFMEKNGVKIPLSPEEEIICWDPKKFLQK